MNADNSVSLALHDAVTYEVHQVLPSDILDAVTLRVETVGKYTRLKLKLENGYRYLNVIEPMDLIKRTLQLGLNLNDQAKAKKRRHHP